MGDLEQLMAIEALKKLKASYCRLVDGKDWAGFAALFAADAVLVPSGSAGGGEQRIEGAEAIAAWVAGKLDGASSVHLAFLPEITLVGPGLAQAVWAMEDRVEWADRSLHGFGHYHEKYGLTAGGWRILETRLVRTRFRWSTRYPGAADRG